MTEERTSHQDAEWGVRLGEARRRVEQLPREERKRGARLSERYWALVHTCDALRGTKEFLTENHEQRTLEVLDDLRREIDGEFRTFQEEHSIPDVGAPVE